MCLLDVADGAPDLPVASEQAAHHRGAAGFAPDLAFDYSGPDARSQQAVECVELATTTDAAAETGRRRDALHHKVRLADAPLQPAQPAKSLSLRKKRPLLPQDLG